MFTSTLKTSDRMTKTLITLITVFMLFSCNNRHNINIEKEVYIKTEEKQVYSDYYLNCNKAISISKCINSSNCGGLSCQTLSCGNICYTRHLEYSHAYKKCMNFLSQPKDFDSKSEIIQYHESMYRFTNRKISCLKRTQSIEP